MPQQQQHHLAAAPVRWTRRLRYQPRSPIITRRLRRLHRLRLTNIATAIATAIAAASSSK
jgi:hypothetical protein